MASKYIAPQKDIRSFTCPHCNTVSQMEFNQHHFSEIFGVITNMQLSVTC